MISIFLRLCFFSKKASTIGVSLCWMKLITPGAIEGMEVRSTNFYLNSCVVASIYFQAQPLCTYAAHHIIVIVDTIGDLIEYFLYNFPLFDSKVGNVIQLRLV